MQPLQEDVVDWQRQVRTLRYKGTYLAEVNMGHPFQRLSMA